MLAMDGKSWKLVEANVHQWDQANSNLYQRAGFPRGVGAGLRVKIVKMW